MRLARVALLSALCFLILSTAWWFRTTGIHIDAARYLAHAFQEPYGDTAISGKPPLFYLFNYAVFHTLGVALGRFQPLSLQIVYIVLFSISLAWAAAAVQPGDSMWAACLRVALLALSPLALLNATWLMMESAALVLITVAVGCAATASSNRRARAGLGVSTALAVAVKSTTVPGLLLIAWAFRDRLRGRAVVIPLGIAAGFVLNLAAQHAGGQQGGIVYGGLRQLISPAQWGRLPARVVPYATTWIFFVGIGLAIAAGTRNPAKNGELKVLALGSLAAVMLFPLASIFTFIRYCYPVMWVAVAGALLTIDVRKRALVCVLVLLEVVQVAPLFARSPVYFMFWPPIVTGEMINSGGTMFAGLPIDGMTVRQLLRDDKPCVWVNELNGESNDDLEIFARTMFPGGTVLVSPAFDPAANASCTAANTVRLWREHVAAPGPNAACAAGCGPCAFQQVDYFSSAPGWVRNQACWP